MKCISMGKKPKKYLKTKIHNQQIKNQPKVWEKIFINHISGKGLISKMYKELIQLNNRKNIFNFKTGKGTEQIFSQTRHTNVNRYMTRFSTSQNIREMKIRITMRYYSTSGVGCHFLLQGIFPTQGSNPGLQVTGRFFTTEPQGRPSIRIATIKKTRGRGRQGHGEGKSLDTLGGNINQYSHFENNIEAFQEIESRTTNDLAIPPLCIYPKEMKSGSRRSVSTPMVIVVYSQYTRYKNNLSVHQ